MRSFILFIACVFLAFPAVVRAQCEGTDLRASLSDAERAALQSAVDAMAYPEGNHWRATKGAQVLHLVGTVHVDDPRLDPVMARLAPIIESAREVWVEATPEGEAELQARIAADPSLVFLTSGPTLPELLSEAEWTAIREELSARGIPAVFAAKFKPWYLSLTLALPPCVLRQAMSGARGLDHRIMTVAQAEDVPVKALEAPDTLLTLMAEIPLETQLDVLRAWVPTADLGEDAVVTTLASYFEERPAEIAEVSRLLTLRESGLPPDRVDALFEQTFGSLLDTRNLAWIKKIDALPGEGLTVIAVGAGHLPGENGLLRLLEQRGYRLDRQRF